MTGTPTFGPEQLKRVSRATVSHGTKEGTVWGTLGTLLHFGFVAEAGGGDLEATGDSRSFNRPSYTRSRFLGDTSGTNVQGGNVQVMAYPSKRGNALPGRPFKLQDLETGDMWHLHYEGDWGVLVSYMLENRPPVDTQLWGLTGNRHVEPILAQDPGAGT